MVQNSASCQFAFGLNTVTNVYTTLSIYQLAIVTCQW